MPKLIKSDSVLLNTLCTRVFRVFFALLRSAFSGLVFFYTRARVCTRTCIYILSSPGRLLRSVSREESSIKSKDNKFDKKLKLLKVNYSIAVFGVLIFAGIISVTYSLAAPMLTNATTTDTINFQARLESKDGAIAPDGNYNIEFKLYSASTGGTALWTEDYLNSTSNPAVVSNGYVTVNLGSSNPFPSNIPWDQQLYLTMNVGGTGPGVVPTSTSTVGWDGEMSPRLLLTAVPYAFQAQNATDLQETNGSNVATLEFAAPPSTTLSYKLPSATVDQTICTVESGNCGGSGGGITGSGTGDYVARFASTGSTITSSTLLYDNSTFIGVGTTTDNGSLSVQGLSAGTPFLHMAILDHQRQLCCYRTLQARPVTYWTLRTVQVLAFWLALIKTETWRLPMLTSAAHWA
jgi:hypothetical protein